ncbi:hypothetical protein IMG5_021820 [Ichthyophthirius multifiliis]|uniref:Centromere protein J C-terminal domain-containing protein n=1 Tax=Ichthyophthirius multifiliis TaxID=5932 RepID=G0QKT8_ICHMU|nr:hypothetical protein IMG5_021820 [Ichthyophthirius multifiliis]EGR34162.1 hypothetical protein IMG5_021820 [Ichthyophthirius multifiliis]|eukprot:XP_004039466.1 hypothetical protein IMG5_021820 [Ichthyophthirius multifiliis]
MHNSKETSKKFKYDISNIGSQNISISILDKLIDQNQFQYDQNQFYQQYQQSNKKTSKIIQQTVGQDGKVKKIKIQKIYLYIQITRFYEDQKIEYIFANKVKKQVFPNKYSIVNFINQDIKQVLPDETIIYYFADAFTTQTTFPNGVNVYKFPNDQYEIHFPNGQKEIKFCDGTMKFISETGEEVTYFEDGTIQTLDVNKVKKCRYKNGEEKIFYPDDYEENQYIDEDDDYY